MIHEFRKRLSVSLSLRRRKTSRHKIFKKRKALISNTQPEQQNTRHPICKYMQTRTVRTVHTHILGQWNSNENHSFGSFSYCLLSLSWSITLSHKLFLLLSLVLCIWQKKWWILVYTQVESSCVTFILHYDDTFSTQAIPFSHHPLTSVSLYHRLRYRHKYCC